MSRSKVAIIHPRLQFGGSEAAALWSIQALKPHYGLTLITSGKVDLERLNNYYGTQLDPREFSILLAPQPLRLARTRKFAGLRGAFVQRFCRKVASRFDLIINTYNVCDYGVPTIQLIADFSFNRDCRLSLNPALKGRKTWWYAETPIRKAYLKLCTAIGGNTSESWKKNLILANSQWSAKLMYERFGIRAEVLYPPVADGFPSISFEQRENGFVCVGRVVPEKRVETIIEIVRRVREGGSDTHLHILGFIDNSAYGREIKRLCNRYRDWVFAEGVVFGPKKKELLARHRFGINGCTSEAFGIAVAEMVKAGCIVFVPASGGQAEIVNHPALTYQTEADAVSKIETALASVTAQESLRRHLAEQGRKFSVEKFTVTLQEVAAEALRGTRCAS
jgi:glycosyltransferase involved in cell wall biosynthesis